MSAEDRELGRLQAAQETQADEIDRLRTKAHDLSNAVQPLVLGFPEVKEAVTRIEGKVDELGKRTNGVIGWFTKLPPWAAILIVAAIVGGPQLVGSVLGSWGASGIPQNMQTAVFPQPLPQPTITTVQGLTAAEQARVRELLSGLDESAPSIP